MMKCPVDGADLLITERQGIEIDYCPKCRGVWLDRGELDKLIERSLQVERGSYTPAAGAPLHSDEYPKSKNTPPAYDDRQRYLDDDFDEDRRRYPDEDRHRKKRGFLGDLFDIFD